MKWINEIVCGDCLELMKELPEKSIDLIITDPPYSTPVITSFGRQRIKNLADLSIQEFYFKAIRIEFERILKSNGRVFIFCDDKFYPILYAVFYEWQNLGLIVWDKGRIGMGYPIRKQHELILYANQNSYDFNKFETTTHISSILKIKHDKNRIHGSQKPIELIEYLIKGFSIEGDIILDPFVGSGTTCYAAIRTKRKYIGIELNPEYCEMARARIKPLLDQQKLDIPK